MEAQMKILNFFLLVALFLNTSLFSAQAIEDISIKSSVIFNTFCAKCHEGQCSGRLSFNTGSKKASNHIKRYAGDSNLTSSETGEFFILLNHMKTKCSILMPYDGKWEVTNLSHFALPSKKGYFIPLGLLGAGKYNLKISTKKDAQLKVEILSSQFDHFLDQRIFTDKEEQTLTFKIVGNTNTFIRIQSRNSFQILSLKLDKNP